MRVPLPAARMIAAGACEDGAVGWLTGATLGNERATEAGIAVVIERLPGEKSTNPKQGSTDIEANEGVGRRAAGPMSAAPTASEKRKLVDLDSNQD